MAVVAALGALVALSVVGIVLLAIDRLAPNYPAAAGPTATPTVNATASPTPSPSPTSTPYVRPTPTPATAEHRSVVFLNHVVAARAYVSRLLAAKDAEGLYRWTDQERQWLEAHPPDECYAEAHSSYRLAVSLYRIVAGDLMFAEVASLGTFDDRLRANKGFLDDAWSAADASVMMFRSIDCG